MRELEAAAHAACVRDLDIIEFSRDDYKRGYMARATEDAAAKAERLKRAEELIARLREFEPSIRDENSTIGVMGYNDTVTQLSTLLRGQ